MKGERHAPPVTAVVVNGSSPKEVNLLAVKEQGNVIEFHHYD
jgi:hypothetical protein